MTNDISRHVVMQIYHVVVVTSERHLGAIYTGNTKHLFNICTMLDQRRRRWADVVQMLYKCFVLAG